MDFIGAVAIAVLLWVGRNEIGHGAMKEGVFFAFIVALFKMYDPVRRFGIYYNNFQQAAGASAAIFDFMDDQDEVVEAKHPKRSRDSKIRSRWKTSASVMRKASVKDRLWCCTTST